MKNKNLINTAKDKEQIEKYDSLKWDDTYRGQTVILLRILAVTVIALSFMNKEVYVTDLIFDMVFLLPLLILLPSLIHKGKVWAIIVTQILLPFVVIRGVSVYLIITDFKSQEVVLIVGFFVYAIVVKSLLKSYQVEKARKQI